VRYSHDPDWLRQSGISIPSLLRFFYACGLRISYHISHCTPRTCLSTSVWRSCKVIMVFAATWHMPLPKYGYISVSPCALASKAASWSRSAELPKDFDSFTGGGSANPNSGMECSRVWRRQTCCRRDRRGVRLRLAGILEILEKSQNHRNIHTTAMWPCLYFRRKPNRWSSRLFELR
jgi:hypothetical protein